MGKGKAILSSVLNFFTGGGSGLIQSGITAVAGLKDKKLDHQHAEAMQSMLQSMKKEELVQAAMDSARRLAIADSKSSSWFAKNIRPIGGFIALFVWVATIWQRSTGNEFIILMEQDYTIIYTILGFYYGSRLLEKLFNKTR